MSDAERKMVPDEEEMEDIVLNTLPSLNVQELEEIYTIINLTCNEEWKGKRMILIKSLLKYLCDIDTSVDAEQGKNTMMLIYNYVHKDKKTDEDIPPLEGDQTVVGSKLN